MTEFEARQKVLQALSVATHAFNDPDKGLRLRDPSNDLDFDELGLDSFDAIECCIALEESVGFEIDPADLTTYNSVNKLAKYIADGAAR